MNIYVCFKQVPDTETKIEVKGEAGINETGIKWIANPYDEFAMEEALQLKEKHLPQAAVVVVSLGPQRTVETIRQGLAMGADTGIHILTDETLDPMNVARALAQAIQASGEAAVVFAGRQAIDDDGNQIHIRLARHLGCAVATNVTAFTWTGQGLSVSREIEEGAHEHIDLKVPAVIAVTKGINTPRYPTVPNIMKAKKKEIKTMSLSDLGITAVVNFATVVKLSPPVEKIPGRVLKGEQSETVPQLVQLLRQEKKVI